MSQPGGLTAIALPQLEQLLRGIESGDLATPVTSAALQARGMGAHWTDVAWLASLGRPSIEAVLRVAIAERKTRPAPRLELVWTGPEVRASSARDTAVVVRELFARARTRVLVAGYAFRGGRDIFEPTSIWRIACDTPDYVSDDLTGRGAEITGGRWNRKGTPMVYASCSRALACLEALLHLAGPEPLPLNRFLVEVVVPDGVWSAREIFRPPFHVGWDAEPPGKISMDWGNGWALGKSSVLAEVPSIVVPEEPNLLLNPEHRDIGQLTAIKLRRWTYDVRLG